MSDADEPKLDDCGCCETEPPETEIFNPPGQPQLRYRIDTQPTFLQRMINDLPHQTVPPGSAVTVTASSRSSGRDVTE